MVVDVPCSSRFNQLHSVVSRGDTDDLGIKVQVVLRQLAEDGIDVFLAVISYHGEMTRQSSSRAALNSEPFRLPGQLEEMVVVEEADQGGCGEVEGGLIGRRRPYSTSHRLM